MKDTCCLGAYKASIHGGLETCYFIDKNPKVNIIVISCDMLDEHMTTETFYTKSIPVVMASLFEVFENINKL